MDNIILMGRCPPPPSPLVYGPGPRFTKILKSDRNRKHISGANMRFTKIIIL